MRTQRLLTIVAFLQVLTLLGQWCGAPTVVSNAHAQVPDPGRDRLQMVDALRSMDGKLDKLNDLLASGKLQVRSVNADESKVHSSGR